MRTILPALALVFSLSLAAADAQETVTPAPDTDSVAASAEPAASVATQSRTGTGLPARQPPPRTMESHWPVFLLFAVSWIGIVAYSLVTGRRAGRLAGELRDLEERG